MTLKEQVFTQAELLAGSLDSRQSRILQLLCDAATISLTQQLRQGLSPADCKADFIAAASLLALANLGTVADGEQAEILQAGDLTIRRSGKTRDAASRCLQRQAEMLIAPYLKDRFSFLGV